MEAATPRYIRQLLCMVDYTCLMKVIKISQLSAKNPPEGFEQNVLSKVAANVQSRAVIDNLVTYLQTRGILSARDINRLTNPHEDRASYLLQVLTFWRRGQDPLNVLYLSLRDSYESDVGMKSHYYIAKEVREQGMQ